MADENTDLRFGIETYHLKVDGWPVRFFHAPNRLWWCDMANNDKVVELLRQVKRHSDDPAVKLYLQSDYCQNMTLEEFLEAVR